MEPRSAEDGSLELPATSYKPSDDLSLSQMELIERIRWLINLRWLAFVGVVITILATRALFVSSLPWDRLLVTSLAIPAYNLVLLLHWRHVNRAGSRQLERASSRLANIQILCDLVALGTLIHLSGGIENPFGFYFVFHMVIASFLLSVRAAFAQATVAFAIFVSVALGEYYGVLVHYYSPVGVRTPGLHFNGLAVLGSTWVIGTSLYVTVYLATSIATCLRRREDQVTALSHEIKRHADDLQVACDKLAAIEKAKSAYTRKVAHELRSPLAAIDGLLRCVAEDLKGEIADEARETVVQARRRLHELLSVIRDLLALAAATQGKLLGEWESVDIRALLNEVVTQLADSAKERGITIKLEIGRELPEVHGDRKGIEELLTNLIGNAVKYSYANGEVVVRLYWRRKGVQIEVVDSGIGMDEVDKENVFEEFYRAGNAREFTPDGTGLGLSIVKSIVDTHAGSITLESKKGQGSRFIVWLPGIESRQAKRPDV